MTQIDTIKLTTKTDIDNPVLHDLELSNGNLLFSSGKEAIAQKCKERLMFFKGEWYMNQNLGFPYFSHVFIKNPSLPTIRSLISQTLLGVKGVQKINNIDVSFNRKTREISVKYTVTTDEEEIIQSSEMVLGIPNG